MKYLDKSIEIENKLVIAKAGSSGEQEVTADGKAFLLEWWKCCAVITQFCEYTKNH